MISTADPKPMSRTSAIVYAISLPLGLAALVFLPAGWIDWTAGRIFIAVLVAAFGFSGLLLVRLNPMTLHLFRDGPPSTSQPTSSNDFLAGCGRGLIATLPHKSVEARR